MNSIKQKLDSLCVLRELLEDSVISALRNFLENPDCSSYAEFVSCLYNSNGGNLSRHISKICDNSSNIYVRLVGENKTVSDCIKNSLCAELDILQQISDLSSEEMKKWAGYNGFLPDFESEKINLCENYFFRAENIGRFGYGIFADNKMFYVDGKGSVVPVSNPDKTRLSDLVDYERERKIIMDNTLALLKGKPAANILLTGDAGTGKSSTVKAIGNELFDMGLRIVEIRKDQLRAIPALLDELSHNPLKFVLFIDDLSFLKDDDNFNALKAVLEGSVSAKSDNVVIYATSNRRHIINEKFSDREGDEIHRNDTLQEIVSLSERFGIHVSYYKPNKITFLNIVRNLAEQAELDVPVDELEAGAERLALERGGRSARLAKQYIDNLLSKR